MFSWLNFISYTAITAVTPGPNNIMCMSNASRVGIRRNISFHLGIWAGLGILILVCTLLSDILMSFLPSNFTIYMKIVGCIYILFLAYKTATAGGDIHEVNTKSGFVTGILLQFVNVKTYIYCILTMQIYVLPYYSGNTVMLVVLSQVMALIGVICTFVWALFGTAIKQLMGKHHRIVNTVMALLLVYCAVSLFW